MLNNLFADNSIPSHVEQIFGRATGGVLNARSIITLIVVLAIALLGGRLLAAVLRRVVLVIGKQADRTEDLRTVNRLRRYETVIVLSIAVGRTLLVALALYFWWQFVHPSGQPSAIIGIGALVAVAVGGALSAPLRDIATGSVMMAEQWYGVGDHIRVEPFIDLQGVVERVTLRSTRMRGLNGEIIWLNNQWIQGVRVDPRGIRTMGLELFVTNLEAGEKIIETTNKRLPIGPLLVVTPLEIRSSEQVGESLWHITALSETAPGREWLIEKSAVDLIKWLDSQNKEPIIAHGPLARYADSEAERRFIRTIHNARKSPTAKQRRVRKAPPPSSKT